jgi:hypothetical protein
LNKTQTLGGPNKAPQGIGKGADFDSFVAQLTTSFMGSRGGMNSTQGVGFGGSKSRNGNIPNSTMKTQTNTTIGFASGVQKFSKMKNNPINHGASTEQRKSANFKRLSGATFSNGQDSMKKRTSSKVNVQPSTSQNLYSMIYASRQKNLVSNYLKDMDQVAKKSSGSRNTTITAP